MMYWLLFVPVCWRCVFLEPRYGHKTFDVVGCRVIAVHYYRLRDFGLGALVWY